MITIRAVEGTIRAEIKIFKFNYAIVDAVKITPFWKGERCDMVVALLGAFFAGICAATVVLVWFYISYRELSKKRKSLDAIKEQVNFHRRLYMQERGGKNDTAARHILKNKLKVYREVEQDYNALLKKPLYHIPGHVMGFRISDEETSEILK